MPARDRLLPAALLLVAVGVALVAHTTLGDYNLVASNDNPAPMIDLLARGEFARVGDVIPAMGLPSILLRVPAAVIGGSNLELTYGLGALLCILPSVLLAWMVDGRLAAQGRESAYRALLGGLLVVGPAVIFALDAGHPEEILAGTLCIFAVLAAQRDRVVAAGMLLGLAIGTKQWALVATFPVVLAIDPSSTALITRRRIQAAVVGALTAVACVAPVIAINPDRYSEVSRSLSGAVRAYPQSLLWPAAPAETRTIPLGNGETQSITSWAAPFGITRGPWIATTLLLGLALIPLQRRAARRTRDAPHRDRIAANAAADGRLAGTPVTDDRPELDTALDIRPPGLADPLTLLTTLLVARCLLDPMNLDYYAAPALAALATREALTPRGPSLPLWSLGAAAGAFVAWRVFGDTAPTLEWAVWLVAFAPILAIAIPRRHSAPAYTETPVTR